MWKNLAAAQGDPLNYFHHAPSPHVNLTTEATQMLEELWQSFVVMIPIFILLTMIFGAGFYIGRVTKKDT